MAENESIEGSAGTTTAVKANAQPPAKWQWIGVWATIISLGVGILAVLIGVYLYQKSIVAPDLTYTVHPLRTELRAPDFDSDLAFTYRGQPISERQVTSLQVAIWNAGTESIRAENVLQAIYLRTEKPVRILSARVTQTNRPVSEFETVRDEHAWAKGQCQFRWRILEPNAAAMVQIIYVGDADTAITLSGVVERQPTIRRVAFTADLLRLRTVAWREIVTSVVASVATGGTVLMLALVMRGRKMSERQTASARWMRRVKIAIGICAVALALGVVWAQWRARTMFLPFDW